MIDIKALLDFDTRHIWHPYTSMKDPLPVYPVKEAKGVWLYLYDGKRLIDGMASWWAVIHGYNHPVLNQAICKQVERMSHVMFGGITHEPAVSLARRLLEITPRPLDRIFFADSGSVSVEVALKMAIQYWTSKGKGEKKRFLTVLKGYHGDTFGAMSVCDPINGMHELFTHVLPQHLFAPEPPPLSAGDFKEEHIEPLREIAERHRHEIAAVIIEPVVQGAGGMRFYSPAYLKRLRELCDSYDLLLIFDEIATGFGRTGELFASYLAGVSPDIMCVGKALTGGYMTFGATLTTEEVALTISEGKPGVFMHGPTFMGNPLACAVSLASIQLLFSYDWKGKVKKMEEIMRRELSKCADVKGVNEVRVLGSIGVVEMMDVVDVAQIQKMFVEKGVWIRPFGKLIYIMPPYVIEEDELVTLCNAIFDIVRSISAEKY